MSDLIDRQGSDLIDRQAAIDAPEKFIKDCNPEHFIGQRKFIEFMDDAEIGSFGMWQFANGFNIGLTAAEVAIKNLPSAQPDMSEYSDKLWKLAYERGKKEAEERKVAKWIRWWETKNDEHGGETHIPHWKCGECGTEYLPHHARAARYCMRCGCKMEVQE